MLLYLLLAVAIGFGLFLPLMENDSAQHATMAMEMAKSGDYLSILKGGDPYLDKPHMHFWLAAFSMDIFGFEVWAYRLPAVILTIIGAFATCKLAKILYGNEDVGKLSALIFLTSQAVILSMHDVRTDGVLVAFTVLAVWQWTRFLKFGTLWGAILGGIFTGFAYSTKGIIAIGVTGAFLFFTVLYFNYWKRLMNYKLVMGLLALAVASFPMLYAYNHQFGTEGIEFITYGQATGRYSGEDFGGASKNDISFYFHTLLWAFIPWSLWFYYGMFLKGKLLLKKLKIKEISTIATVLLFMVVMNFSSFKLPHYLNIVLPFAAIFTAGTAVKYFQKYRTSVPKFFQITQYILVAAGIILTGFLASVAFPMQEIPVIVLMLAALLIVIILFVKSQTRIERSVVVSAGFILFANIYLNSTFYPQLLNYQAGFKLGNTAKSLHIEPNDIYMIDGQYSWPMDWAIEGTTQKADRKTLYNLNEPFWVMMYDIDPNSLKSNKFDIAKSYRADHYRITRLTWDFINPLSRPETLKDAWLVKYVPK